ncbi:fungal-specific transcription factor domain-containing protein [Roridomyces roridus]|uniref:Fungal-specific transcription factor domain-containing protein n=1 Tax=Roridomyces roridus TaxID=1738132 RepID=A0AAD7FIK3_9AGAR|nr:fungal-specific transcription factor domain-containing protein [Roridomyces roridus]
MTSAPQTVQSRRTPFRSCDQCRKRKVRCDGHSRPDHQCSNCSSFGEICSYSKRSKQPNNSQRLVEELQQRVATLEAQLRTLSVCSLCSRSLESSFDASREQDSPREDDSADENADPDMEALTRQFKHSLLGSDSAFNLVQNTITIKDKYLGRQSETTPLWKRISWDPLPWEQEFFTPRSSNVFPPDDLIVHLMDLYFTHVHPILPILNRTFLKRQVEEKLYLTDPHLEAVLLAVLAIASRLSNDPRVMIAGNTLSCGWQFISQMRIVPNLSEPTVYDAQFYALMTFFCLGGLAPHITWVYLGLGARVIQYHGRFPRRSEIPDVEEELWNRAFWSIFVLDGFLSAFLGRPPTIHAEEYDVPPPLEVEDEYWESGFVQPAGKSSTLSFFVYFVRLFEILVKALHRLYASRPKKIRMGWTAEHEIEVVAELDSLMNNFLDSLPDHLRWPDASGIFFDQSAMLQATYYGLQIAIHRLYIHKQSPATGPSLFICVTAARSSINVAEIWTNKTQRVPSNWFFQCPVFISAIILLLNVFATKRSPGSSRRVDLDKDLAQVQTALRIVKSTEGRWRASGSMAELIQEIQSLDDQFSVDRSQTPTVFPSDPVSGIGAADGQIGGFRPGTSIEQLLAETMDTSSGNVFENMWLAMPSDLMSIDQWEAFLDTVPLMDSSWR